MSAAAHYRKGDRIDWHGHTAGLVTRVGLGTLGVAFETAQGPLAAVVPIEEARPHQSHALRIGAFSLRPYAPGKLKVDWHTHGEAGVFDEARLESLLEKFWAKYF